MPVRSLEFVRCLTVAAVTLPFGAPLAAQSAGDTLRLDDVLELVRERNPRLQALQSSAQAATYREPEASTLPDPTLQFGMMNFGVPNLNTDMAMSMAPSVQLLPWTTSPSSNCSLWWTRIGVSTSWVSKVP